MDELERHKVRPWILKILEEGEVVFSGHALKEMVKDGLEQIDITGVLRAGRMIRPSEFENGGWRYRIETKKICVIIEFESETRLDVVTAWRYKK